MFTENRELEKVLFRLAVYLVSMSFNVFKCRKAYKPLNGKRSFLWSAIKCVNVFNRELTINFRKAKKHKITRF